MIAFERRAATVLFNAIANRRDDRPYLLPANACAILPTTLRAAGARFELVDISARTLCIDADAVIERMRRRRGGYAGLVFVRTYGAILDVRELFREFKRHAPDALLVDDRCLCAPDFRRVTRGSADLVLYSTGRAKCVDLGWGGFAMVAGGLSYRRMTIGAQASTRLVERSTLMPGCNTRQAHALPDWLDTRRPRVLWTDYRAQVATRRRRALNHKRALTALYRGRVRAELQLPEGFQGWRFNLQVANPGEVLRAIFAAGLFASRHYQPITRAFGQDDAPVAEELHRRVINLFSDCYFDLERAHRVVEVVNRIAKPVRVRLESEASPWVPPAVRSGSAPRPS